MKTPLQENRVLLKSYVLPHEKKALEDIAKQLNLSTSRLVARLVAGKELPNVERDEKVRTFAKANADLARLGNLLKMALDAGEFEPNQYNKGTDVESLILEISQFKNELKTRLRMTKDQ